MQKTCSRLGLDWLSFQHTHVFGSTPWWALLVFLLSFWSRFACAKLLDENVKRWQRTVAGYQTIGDTEFTNEEIDYPALIRLDVADLDACQTECSNAPECLGRPREVGGEDTIDFDLVNYWWNIQTLRHRRILSIRGIWHAVMLHPSLGVQIRFGGDLHA